jgi:hypothetical protein
MYREEERREEYRSSQQPCRNKPCYIRRMCVVPWRIEKKKEKKRKAERIR